MKYIWDTTLKSIMGNYRINIVIVVSLFLGLLFPMMLMGGIEDGLAVMNSNQIKNSQRVVLASTISMPLIDEKSMQELIEPYSFVENIAAISTQFTYVTMNEKRVQTTVLGITSNYTDFNQIKMLNGKDFDDLKENFIHRVCLVGEELAIEHKITNHTNKYVNINGVPYKVIGIVKHQGGILIPYGSVVDTEVKKTQHEFYLLCTDEKYMDMVSNIEFFSKMELTQANKRQKNYEEDILNNVSTILIIIVVVLLYSVINTITILNCKFNLEKRKIGILRALGASNIQIYIGNLLETFLLAIIASILVFILAPMLNHIFNGFGEIRLTTWNAITIIAIDILISIGVNAGIVTRLFRCKIAALLKE